MTSSRRIAQTWQHLKQQESWGAVEEIAQCLAMASEKAYLAGGSIRDAWLGRLVKDLDLATSATPDKLESLFTETLPIGRQFGIIKVKAQGHWIEVATFRSDGVYQDQRRPDSVEFTTAEEDARRRDLTINALFLDPLTGELFDWVEGLQDLERKKIAAVGDPDLRFREDALRLLRALRFAAELNFEIESKTSRALKAAMPLVAQISRERVREELVKIFLGSNPAHGFELLHEYGFLKQDFSWSWVWMQNKSEFASFVEEVRRLSKDDRDLQIWALLAEKTLSSLAELYSTEAFTKQLQAFGSSYRLSKKELQQIAGFLSWLKVLVDPHVRIGQKLLVYREPWVDCWFDWLEVLATTRSDLKDREITKAIAELKRHFSRIKTVDHRLPAPLVTGKKILDLGLSQGPELGRIVDEAFLLQLENPGASCSELTSSCIENFSICRAK